MQQPSVKHEVSVGNFVTHPFSNSIAMLGGTFKKEVKPT
jgi:hypothetical protein